RLWLLDQCDKHINAWRSEGWKVSPFNADGSVATDVNLVEKATAVVAFHELASAADAFQQGPAPWPVWKLGNRSREYALRWGIVVSEIKERFRAEHGSIIEGWLEDVEEVSSEGNGEPGKPDRKTRYDKQKDQDMADAWKRAKDSGVKKKQFVKDRRL